MDYFLVLVLGIAVGFIAARWKPRKVRDPLAEIEGTYPYLAEYVRRKNAH